MGNPAHAMLRGKARDLNPWRSLSGCLEQGEPQLPVWCGSSWFACFQVTLVRCWRSCLAAGSPKVAEKAECHAKGCREGLASPTALAWLLFTCHACVAGHAGKCLWASFGFGCRLELPKNWCFKDFSERWVSILPQARKHRRNSSVLCFIE